MSERKERREFHRFPLELLVTVSAQDRDGETYEEKTRLKEISGGGARFITRHREKYFQGQQLEMKIYLPGTDDIRAHMKGIATVSRIQDFDSPEGEKEPAETHVAAMFISPLRFVRG
jgi:hypothetical protein